MVSSEFPLLYASKNASTPLGTHIFDVVCLSAAYANPPENVILYLRVQHSFYQ